MGNRVKSKKSHQKNQTVSAWLRNSFFYAFFLILWGGGNCYSEERIVSLNVCTDELLLQLAEPAQIAGVTRLHHSPLAQAVLKRHSEIARLDSNIESLIKVQPSVVLAGPFSNQLLVEELKRLKVFVMNVAVPRNWNELVAVAEQITELTKQKEKLKRFREQIEMLKKKKHAPKWKGERAVFWSAAGHVAGRRTFEDTILETLGMTNAVKEEGYAFMSLENLIALNPQIILVTQNSQNKNSWSHDTLFHPALKQALPNLKYLEISEEAVSCASLYTVQVLNELMLSQDR